MTYNGFEFLTAELTPADIHALIAELRASRKVVDAARAFVDEYIGMNDNPSDDVPLGVALREALRTINVEGTTK